MGLILTYLKSRCRHFKAGDIQHCLTSWRDITSDKTILQTVIGATIDFNETPQLGCPSPTQFSDHEIEIIDREIAIMLSKNIIEVARHTEGEVISHIFTRPKKDGCHRVILNLKGLNEYVIYRHFKMETLGSNVKLVEKDCFMASLDLKDAYYSVAVAKPDRKFLRFLWKGVRYQYTCLPNGLSSCPRVFTKLLKPPLKRLRKLGHIIASYIDDLFLQGKTFDQCVTLPQLCDSLTSWDL